MLRLENAILAAFFRTCGPETRTPIGSEAGASGGIPPAAIAFGAPLAIVRRQTELERAAEEGPGFSQKACSKLRKSITFFVFGWFRLNTA